MDKDLIRYVGLCRMNQTEALCDGSETRVSVTEESGHLVIQTLGTAVSVSRPEGGVQRPTPMKMKWSAVVKSKQ